MNQVPMNQLTIRQGITPAPTDAEAVAIMAAVEALWPRANTMQEPAFDTSPVWKFSGRWWQRDRYAAAERPWA